MRFSLLNISLLLVLLAFLSFSCEKDKIVVADVTSSEIGQENAEIAGPFQKSSSALNDDDLLELAKAESQVQELVDEVFATLAQAPDLKAMSVAEQGAFLQLNMPSFKADALNLEAAYNDAYASYRPNENEQLEPYLNDIHDIAFVRATSAESVILELEEYEEMLISGYFNLDVAELKIVLQEVYLNKSLFKSIKLKDVLDALDLATFILIDLSNGQNQQFKCFLIATSAIVSLAACATGNILKCGFAIYKFIKLIKCLKGSDYINTCLMSTDPCCGISCIQGYSCNTEGECVIDLTSDPCSSCLPNERCFRNRCVPN